MNRLSYLFGLLILISSCKSKLKNEGIFPRVKDVQALPKTVFVPTLESPFKTQNNIIYGATILFAWNEIKKEIGTALKDFTNNALEELNETTSFVNVLKESKYEKTVEIDDNEISAKAYFRKSLPFEEPLTKFEEPLRFGKSMVASFGFWGYCPFARINYFNNENDFSISLLPENKNHEIILIMHHKIKNTTTFAEYLDILIQQKPGNVSFNDDDKVQIPIIEFNLEKTFGQFIGTKFRSKTTAYIVTEAYQRNAFILNENGAEVESEVEFATEEASAEFEKPTPKRMLFNQPFGIFLKRKDAKNPYFGMYIANDELLKKK